MKTVEFPFEINWPWAIPFCLGNLATLVFWSIFVNCSASGSFHFFVSFSYEKKMWDKWVENLKHKIRWSIAETFSPRWRHFKIKMWAAKASGRNWERAVPEVPFTIHHGNFLRKGQLLFTNQFTVHQIFFLLLAHGQANFIEFPNPFLKIKHEQWFCDIVIPSNFERQSQKKT